MGEARRRRAARGFDKPPTPEQIEQFIQAAGEMPHAATEPQRSAAVPTFHIPIGRTRDADGKVVLWADHMDYVEGLAEWTKWTEGHPATVAAGACVTIGPTNTSYLNFVTKQMIQSATKPGAWQPAALSDRDTPA